MALWLLPLGLLFLLTAPTKYYASAMLIIVILQFAIMAVNYFFLGKIGYKYLYWLLETPETTENRKKWLSFKEFVLNYSELENKPLKYYSLWGEFYYYALAVGGIKRPF